MLDLVRHLRTPGTLLRCSGSDGPAHAGRRGSGPGPGPAVAGLQASNCAAGGRRLPGRGTLRPKPEPACARKARPASHWPLANDAGPLPTGGRRRPGESELDPWPPDLVTVGGRRRPGAGHRHYQTFIISGPVLPQRQ